MGSVSDAKIGGYGTTEQEQLAAREAKQEAINAYNDKANDLKKPELPPVEATQEAPASEEQLEAEKVEQGSTDENQQDAEKPAE